ncbi:hypothetical protein FRX31_030761 [Thalictrum thalictroides]|uniref:Uncharacterized protein n=1 Tax=Thalictrum thalictroides TaxID=46969 RepID=A0A7J6V3X4_THATH|nr:hypothetical protein FRX31_030761 [Thalictrum thalictroides]
MEKNKGREKNIERKNYISAQIDQEDEDSLLAATMMAQVPRTLSSNCSIFRVPPRLRYNGDEKVYEPCIISIGPYHHGKENLKAMEEHKNRYLRSLLNRLTPIKRTLKHIVRAIRELEEDARACYAEPINLTSDEFVKMMVLDGSFIIELFYRCYEPVVANDPIYTSSWMYSSMRLDLALLENQLPQLVLQCIYSLTRHPGSCSCSLNQLVCYFMTPSSQYENTSYNSAFKANHILDVLRNHLFPLPRSMENDSESIHEYTQYSATDLWEAGVQFKKKDSKYGLLDITFSDEGVLEIPSFFVSDTWIVYLPNIIALEQCRRDYENRVTSYVILLDGLINTKDDVKLLRDKKIINVMWKEDELIATEIGNLCSKGAFIKRFGYDDLCRRMNAHHRTDWNRWRSNLRRNYFNTPWASLSFVAAVVLLLLTFLQTIFSILSY